MLLQKETVKYKMEQSNCKARRINYRHWLWNLEKRLKELTKRNKLKIFFYFNKSS